MAWWLGAALIVAIDLLTKTAIQTSLALHETIPVIEGFFNLTYIRNPGAAFGLLAETGGRVRIGFFLVSTFIAIIVLTVLLRSADRDWPSRLAFTLILGGAVGNLIDRIRYGEVVDFLDFYVGRYHWPAFNVADSCITTGIAILLLTVWVKRPPHYTVPPP